VRGPRRTCVGCRAVREQFRLIRLAADGAGGVAVNPRPAIGRGVYLCPTPSCLEQVLRRKVLPHALHAALPRLDPAALRQRVGAEVDRLKTAGAERAHASV
jgi:hypothetical protein